MASVSFPFEKKPSNYLNKKIEPTQIDNTQKITDYINNISFLKDQKELLFNAGRNKASIKAADKLISSEIKRWENEINKL